MWIIYVLLTIASYAGVDFFIKKMAGKINDFLGITILSVVSMLPALTFFIITRFSEKKLMISSNGLTYAVLAGISLGIGMLSFLKLFDTGVELSWASPIVRVGIIVMTVILGLIVLRETVEPKEWAGLIFAAIGVILIIWK